MREKGVCGCLGSLFAFTGANGPRIKFGIGPNLRFCRIGLPVTLAQGAVHVGTWHARLRVDANLYSDELRKADRKRAVLRRITAHGVRYSLSVHTISSLRLKAQLIQRGSRPGEVLNLRAGLSESGIPLANRARVTVDVRHPDGTRATLPLKEAEPGIFESAITAILPGVYGCQLFASGKTLNGSFFRRQKLLTGAVWKGSDRRQPRA
jgi:hypothetical protein